MDYSTKSVRNNLDELTAIPFTNVANYTSPFVQGVPLDSIPPPYNTSFYLKRRRWRILRPQAVEPSEATPAYLGGDVAVNVWDIV